MGIKAMVPVLIRKNAAANMAGVELALNIVAAHLLGLARLPAVGHVAMETWVIVSALIRENAAANMAGVELALIIVVAHLLGLAQLPAVGHVAMEM